MAEPPPRKQSRKSANGYSPVERVADKRTSFPGTDVTPQALDELIRPAVQSLSQQRPSNQSTQNGVPVVKREHSIKREPSVLAIAKAEMT